MLKKSFAIVALSVFFLAQFGRVMNYLYCNWQTYAQTASFVCDCEKQLYAGLHHDINHKEQTPKNITALVQEETLFHLFTGGLNLLHPVAVKTGWPPTPSQALYNQFTQRILRPPLQPAA